MTLQLEGYLPESKIKLKSLVIALQVTILLYLIISFEIRSGPVLFPVFNFFNNNNNNNNCYWSKNPNKGLSSIQNMTNTTKTTFKYTIFIWKMRFYIFSFLHIIM